MPALSPHALPAIPSPDWRRLNDHKNSKEIIKSELFATSEAASFGGLTILQHKIGHQIGQTGFGYRIYLICACAVTVPRPDAPKGKA
jgi:hypothetical protein